jgi:hypothetical protein
MKEINFDYFCLIRPTKNRVIPKLRRSFGLTPKIWCAKASRQIVGEYKISCLFTVCHLVNCYTTVRLNLCAESTTYSAVFFSHNKSANYFQPCLFR